MKQRFNVQVDFACNFDDDKRPLDRRLAKVVAYSIALACVYSFLFVLLSATDVSRERRPFFPANCPSGREVTRDGCIRRLRPLSSVCITNCIHVVHFCFFAGAIQDIKAAAQFLLKSGCKKVGVTGFCMGGALSLAAAALVPEISAAAPFYGIPDISLANVSTIKIPVQCHFGKNDSSNTANPVEYMKLEQKLKVGGVDYEFYEYDAGHAFTNPQSRNYNKTVAELSVGRMIEFMNKHLAVGEEEKLSVESDQPGT